MRVGVGVEVAVDDPVDVDVAVGLEPEDPVEVADGDAVGLVVEVGDAVALVVAEGVCEVAVCDPDG